MKKKNFISLILGLIGGILFALGMCMCTLSAWNAMRQGVVVGLLGAAVLLAMLIVRRRMEGKPAIVLNAKAIGNVLLGVIGALVLGVGMCMVFVWGMLLQGVLVGVIGIVLLICLIPLYKGIKD